jgi:hypothetical protein
VRFHVITDANGDILGWIKAPSPTQSGAGPHLIIAPENPNHIVHENIEIESERCDRANLRSALAQAVAQRIGRP